MKHFADVGLPQPLMRSLERMNYTTPTPIQEQAVPPALAGKDILGSAQTGTGKTAAFGIPLANYLISNSRGSALVLLPTRELAVQVMETLEALLADSRIPTTLLIGGEAMPKQFAQLRARPRLIVGTPGRINDHLQRGTLMLHDTRFLVLDETDRMLDMGFGIQLDAIAKYLTGQRQTLMFSATLPANIIKLAQKYLTNPVRIAVGSVVAPAANLSQQLIEVSEDSKYQRLVDELEAREGSVIVFVKTKYGTEKLATRLCKQGVRADALHGDLKQSRRERVIDAFRDQKFRVLVATDIASRGLDIPHIEHVINYDLPQCPEDYIHRIGRTARAGAEGAAVTLLTPADKIKWRAIQKLMNPDAAGESEERSYGGKSNGRPGGKPGGGKPRRGRSGGRSFGDTPRGDKPHGEKSAAPQGAKPAGEGAKKRRRPPSWKRKSGGAAQGSAAA